jgi:dipeptidyl aminopeptidase/acylaminoacyl peptidase
LTDGGDPYLGLYRCSLDGVLTPVFRGDGDVEDVLTVPGGIIFQVNRHGAAVWWEQHGDEAPREIPMAPAVMSHVNTAPRDSRLWVIRDSPAAPPDLYRWTREGGFEAASHSYFGGSLDATAPEEVQYESGDGVSISGWWYPREPARSAVIVLHGGPEAQERPRYSASVQTFLEAGVAVLVPNGRGSTGFGRRFQELVYGDWGGGDLEDVMAGLAFVRGRLGQRVPVGLLGLSYGGFLVLSALSRRPEAGWGAGVAIDAPSDLVRLVEGVPEAVRPLFVRLVGDPEHDRERLTERSPLTHAHRVEAPLLVVHGENDPRVSRTQSDALVKRLNEVGRPVTYHVIGGEGHGFVRQRASREVHRLAISFLLEHLMPTD